MSYSLPTIHYRFDVDGTNSGTLGSALNASIPSGILFDSVNKKIGDKCISILRPQATSSDNRMAVSTWTTPTNFTISLWARVVSRVSTGQALMEWNVGGLVFALVFWTTTTNFLIYYNGTQRILTIPNMYDDAYHHYLFTVASNGDITMYIDNISQGSVNHNPSPTGKSVSLTYIGSRSNADPVINGYIDDFKIYDYIADAALRNVIYKLGIGTSVSQLISEGATQQQLLAGGATYSTMTITSSTISSGATTSNTSIALTFTSSASTSDFVVGDITVTNGTLSSPLGGSGSVYTATFTPTAQGVCTIIVQANKFTAGGFSNSDSNTFTFTYVPVTMTITSTTAGVTSGATTNNTSIALTFTSSASTSDFVVGDISVTNGTLSSPLGGSGSVYTATFTPTDQGVCTIIVQANKFTVSGGGNNIASNTFTWTFDSVSPSMTISSTTSGVTTGSTTNNTSIALTFTSTEATNNFAVGDISVTNGSLSAFTAVSSTVYTATFTPTTAGLCTIDVAAGVYTDAATNINNLATQFTWTFDNVPPTITITSTTPGVTSDSTTNNASIALTFTSSKATNNFVIEDISVTNGTLSSPLGGSGSVYTATFTPAGPGACTIGVAGGVFTDALGNNNAAATTFNWTFDSVTPGMTITSTTSGVTTGSTTNNATIALTFTASASTSDFVLGDISLTNGTLSNFTASSGTVYTAIFTPTNQGLCTIGVASGAFTYAAGNSNNASNTFNWTFDSISPTMTITSTAATNTTIALTFTSSKATTNFAVGDISVTNGTLSAFDGSGAVYTATFTPASQGTCTIGVAAGAYTDAAGNSNIATTFSIYYILNFGQNNDANKLEETYIMGFLDVSGDIIQRSGNLIVMDGNLLVNAGDVSFNTGKLYVAGNVSTNSNMTVAGATKVTHIATSGNMDVSGVSSLDGTLTIANATSFNDNVSIANNNAFIVGSGTTTMGGIVSLNSQLTIAEDIFMNSTLKVLGATTLTNVYVDGNLLSSGKTIFLNDVSFNGAAVDICGNLYAQYPAGTIPLAAVNMGDDIFQTDVSMNARLNVAGATTMSSIIASDTATVGGTLVVVGATTLSTLNTSSNAAVGGALIVSGKTTGSGDISFNGSRIDICGNLYANYPANSIPGAAIIPDNSPIFDADVSMNARLNIVGATTLSSLVASGKTIFSSDVSMNGSRIDICGNLYANYPSVSIPQSAIAGSIGSLFTTDVTMNTRLYVRDRITLGSATLQYRNVWEQIGADIDGEALSDSSGRSVALSSDGSIVAIGSSYNDGTTTNANDNRGHVRVYRIVSGVWTKLGNDIDGEATDNYSGYSVSLSDNGLILAIGAFRNDGTTTDTFDQRGHVRVYQIDLSNIELGWQQIGQDIDGEATGDNSGWSVSLSSNGLVLAIGAPNNDGTTTNVDDNRGHVRVYERDASNNTIEPHGWIQVGGDIDGELGNQGGNSGWAISLSSDGSIIAIGAFMNDGISGNDSGHVRVYQRNILNETIAPVGWSQLGNDIDGESTNDQSGYSVSLSSDGSIVAIGAIYNDVTTGNINNNRGSVRVYRIDLSNTVLGWNQLGGDIDGEAAGDNSGISVSLSGDGTIVAIGANINGGTTNNPFDYRGHVRVYQRNLSTNIWTQWGPDIDGEASGDQSGFSVALSRDGLSVAIGALENDGTTTNTGDARGSVRIYKRDINAPVAGLIVDNSVIATDVSLGTLSIGNTLGITGATTLTTLAVSGNSSVGGTLAITGATTTTTFISSGSSTLGGTLAVTGATTFAADASLNSKLTVLGDVSMNSNLFVGGDVSLNSRLFVGGDVSLNSALSIVGATTLTDTTINGILNVTGATTVPSLNVVSNLTGTTLRVTGQSILSGDVSMNSKLIVGRNVTMNSKLAVTGATTISALTVTGNAIVGGTLPVTGKSIFTGDVSMNSTALVAGDVSLNSNLTVATNTNISGTLRVTGATAASSTLAVTGATTVGGTLAVSGKSTFAANATFNGNVDISGNLSVVGSTVISNISITNNVLDIWSQVGGDIDGEASTNLSGTSVAVSSDGSIIAIGAPNNNGTGGTTRGSVRVYKRNILQTGPTVGWAQLGGDIDGEASSDQSGFSVSLSSDGSIVAIGAPFNAGTAGSAGHVRVYQYNPNKLTGNALGPIIGWDQLGEDINPENPGYAGQSDGGVSGQSGYSVSLSRDGTIVAIGSNKYSGTWPNLYETGQLRIYKRDTGAIYGWRKLGGTFLGEFGYDWFGSSISLSKDGLVVAIGAIQNDGTNGTSATGDQRGHVRVFKYNPNKLVAVTDQTNSSFGPVGWDRLGADIDGEAAGDNSGVSVALSSDGSIVAIGANLNDGTALSASDSRGHVRVYKYTPSKLVQVTDQTSSTFGPVGWNRLGNDIDGEATGDQSGRSVALSEDGSIVAIGAPYNDGTGTLGNDRGHARVYRINLSNPVLGWQKIGSDIDGEVQLSLYGISIALSGDGSVVVIGGTQNDGTVTNNVGDNRGHVRVFKLQPVGVFMNQPLVSTDLITTGNSTISGPLSVTGSAAISSTLSVSGATTLTSITTSRNAAFGSTLQVTGATTMSTLQVTGATTMSTLAATSNAVIGGTLIVTGATTMTALNVSGLIKKV